jgi:stage II sporulation protein R
MRKLQLRLGALVLGFFITLGIMITTISGEVKKVETANESYKENLIRFHVLANSDTKEDQDLKLLVRDAIIAYLQPFLADSKSVEESEEIIKSQYANIETLSKEIIKENGYDYSVSAEITYANFPTKQYSSVVLPAGEYKALRVEIGAAAGKNWWCVMFPPLCFVDTQNGVIDASTDEKLQEVLSEEEYELIVQKDSNKLTRVEMKFKLVELFERFINNSETI